MENFNELSPAETERLAILAEECAEVQQACMKVLRHGYERVNPKLPPEKQETNRAMLMRELGDLWHAFNRMVTAVDIDGSIVIERGESKAEHVKPYLHHQDASQGKVE